jgi:hypothetical protein
LKGLEKLREAVEKYARECEREQATGIVDPGGSCKKRKYSSKHPPFPKAEDHNFRDKES